jgi:hypothetical protein
VYVLYDLIYAVTNHLCVILANTSFEHSHLKQVHK